MWAQAFGEEFGNLSQGDATANTPGTSIYVMTCEEILHIPIKCTVTYTLVIFDYHPQKTDPNHVCLTAGSNLIDYPSELTTHTANLTTKKF
jgi:hypothetical protein